MCLSFQSPWATQNGTPTTTQSPAPQWSGSWRRVTLSAMSAQDKTDLSLALAAFAATATLLGPIAAAIAAAFIFGLLIGQGRTPR